MHKIVGAAILVAVCGHANAYIPARDFNFDRMADAYYDKNPTGLADADFAASRGISSGFAGAMAGGMPASFVEGLHTCNGAFAACSELSGPGDKVGGGNPFLPGVHAVHDVDVGSAAISPVPEPSSYALMLAGLAVVAGMLRSRR
jgi:hypothetical protein